MHLHLDCVGGIAGDMFIAAVLDAFPQLEAPLVAAVRAAGLPQAFQLSLVEHRDHGLVGHRFLVQEPDGHAGGDAQHPHDEPHGHRHAHDHRSFAEIRALLQVSPLEPTVREHAIAIFTLLAQAEATVHGATVETIGFHEIGEWDSIADIVGAALLIARLDATWSVGQLPLGRGRVRSAHGVLPVPAPATALLLQGFDCIDDGLEGERVTPTGAAIVRHLATLRAARGGRCAGTGLGFGTRRLPGLPNVVRLMIFEPAAATQRNQIAEIMFEVDDQTAEDLAIGLDLIRRHPGTREVYQLPAFGKKGRLVTHVRVLADAQALEEVTDLCLTETATIGLRYQILERKTLARRQSAVQAEGGQWRVKEVQRLGTGTRKVEADDLSSVAGYAQRERLRRRIEGEES